MWRCEQAAGDSLIQLFNPVAVIERCLKTLRLDVAHILGVSLPAVMIIQVPEALWTLYSWQTGLEALRMMSWRHVATKAYRLFCFDKQLHLYAKSYRLTLWTFFFPNWPDSQILVLDNYMLCPAAAKKWNYSITIFKLSCNYIIQ